MLRRLEGRDSLSNLLLGAGGWAYFKVPGSDSLRTYSQVYDFVEVNSTYYEYPELRAVRSWRSRVPRKFEFSVRCHNEIVQALRAPHGQALSRIMERMEEICKILNANILTILIPEKSEAHEKALAAGLEQAISTFNGADTRIAVEIRGAKSKKLLRTMQDNDAVHCVDLSREHPAYESTILYTRLFGKGEHNVYQFDDGELKDIARAASKPKFEKSILAFHGVRMYGDTARLKKFLVTGRFPQITGQTGLESLGEVLREDTAFPASKSELVAKQGWKLFDLTAKKRIRAGAYLRRLPEGRYNSPHDVIISLRRLSR